MPSGAISGEVYARFRVSTTGDLGIGGVAADGEVEDYRFTIDPPAPAAGSFVASEIGPGSSRASLLAVADIDGDGAMDVISTPYEYGRTIVWYRNLGGGNFAQRTVAEPGGEVSSIIATDIDVDGDLDIVSRSSYNAYEMTWYENDGTGDFTEHLVDNKYARGASLAAADVDGDGDLDVLSTSLGLDEYLENPGVHWFENNGSQTFSGKRITTSLEEPDSVFVADIDGDGNMDVLSADGRYGGIVLNADTIISDASRAPSVFAADLDGDGDLDVIGGSAWYENIDGRVFTRHDVDSDFVRPRVVAAADMDGDGDLDLVGGSWRDGTLIWFENVSTPPPADLTDDGFVDFGDLTILLAHWDQTVSAGLGNLVDPLTTPINFQDLTFLLAAWTGPGPVGAAQAAVVGGDSVGDLVGSGPSVAVGDASYRRRDRRATDLVMRVAGEEVVMLKHNLRGGRRAAARFRPAGGTYGRLQAAAVDRAIGEDAEVEPAATFVRRRRR